MMLMLPVIIKQSCYAHCLGNAFGDEDAETLAASLEVTFLTPQQICWHHKTFHKLQ